MAKKAAKKKTKTASKKKAAKKKTKAASKKKATKKKTKAASKKKATKKKTKAASKKKAAKAAQERPTPPSRQVGKTPISLFDPNAADVKARKRRSAAKKKAAMAVVAGTSARMAEKAQASVWAISSDKTLDQFRTIEEREEDAEASRMEALAEPVPSAQVPSELRRSHRDPYVAFRNELTREEDPSADPHAEWRHKHQRLRHELNPGAATEELKTFEKAIGRELSPSYWDFALEWNGGLLYVEQGGCYRIIPVGKLLDEIRGPLHGSMTYPFLPAVDLGCGDYLALDMSKTNRSGENPVYWWYAGEPKRKVAESFSGWLKRLVEQRGRAFWWDL